MSVVQETLSPELVAAFHRGDEAAFERVVKARFDHLCDRAVMALPAEASAGAARVATGALLSAWSAHDRFADAEGVDAFLDEAVAAAAHEEVRRRASLHRFERHEGVSHAAHVVHRPSADEAWADIHATLHVSEADRQRHREEARLEARKHAREHVNRVAKRKVPWTAIVFGVVIVGAIYGFMQWIDRSSAETVLTQALNAPDARTLASRAGQFGTLTLNDNSTARMAAESQLKVPAAFPRPARGLELTGAALFTVAPGLEDPFQVRVGAVRVVATGTAFAVRKYAEEADVIVRVDEGSVQVSVPAANATRDVAAGEALVVAADGTMHPASEAELRAAFGWMDGTVSVTDMPLADVLPVLARWFDLDVELADPSLGERRITAELPLESSGQALDLVIAAGNLALQFDDKQMQLADGSSKAVSRGRR